LTYTPYERAATLVVLACGATAYAIHGPWKPGSVVVRSLLSVLVFSAVWGPLALWYWRRVRKPA
jgi:hypothetical protein